MSVPAYVALEKEPEERSSLLRRQVNKEREGNGIHVKEKRGKGCYLEGRSGSQHEENVVSAWEGAKNKVHMKIPQQIPFCSIQRFTYLKY